MKLHKQIIRKVLIGALLVVLAAGVSYSVRDLLAYRHPEATLPAVRIEYNGTELPAEHSMMDAYSWRYLTLVKDWAVEDREAWKKIEPAPVLPDAPLDVSFSFAPKDLTVSRAKGDSDVFSELSGELRTPTEPGVYTYRVAGEWGVRGAIAYYFRIQVLE